MDVDPAYWRWIGRSPVFRWLLVGERIANAVTIAPERAMPMPEVLRCAREIAPPHVGVEACPFPPPGRASGRHAILALVVFALVLLAGVGLAGYTVLGVSAGEHASIGRPCALLDATTLDSLDAGGVAVSRQMTGGVADCEWGTAQQTTGNQVSLMLDCSSRGLFASAESQAHEEFEYEIRHDDVGHPSAVRDLGTRR